MELPSNIKRTFYKLCIVFLGSCTVLWFSVFSYALLYYLYIPAVAHVKPVHLKYDVSCFGIEKCSFPHANITLVEKDQYELMARGQGYAVELVLDMPETHRNIDQGMFMVRLDILSQNGAVLRSSHRPAILRHRSPLFKVIYTLFFTPALLAGTTEEKQSLSIPLFEKYEESLHHPSYFAFIEIQAKFAEIYSCTLRIHAQFTGLRYMMYYWPILSATVGIGFNFFFVTVIIVFIWVRQIMYAERYINLEGLTNKEKDLVEEIRQSRMKSQAEKFPSREKEIPKLSTGGVSTDIRRRKEAKSMSTSLSEEIENISPHEEVLKLGSGIRKDPESTSRSFGAESEKFSAQRGSFDRASDSSEPQESSSISDEEYSVCELSDPVSEEIETIQTQAAESTSSPGLRRRVVES